MIPSYNCRCTCLAVFVIIAFSFHTCGLTVAQTKLALLIGVEEYEKDGFNKLNFAQDDAQALSAELERFGFTCELLEGKDAKIDAVKAKFESLYAQSKKLAREDVVLVYLSGHGVQKRIYRREDDGGIISDLEEVERLKSKEVRIREKEEPFFCPFDAHKNDVSTLLNINEVLYRLKRDSGSSNNIVLLDACRESVDKGIRGDAGGIDGSSIDGLTDKLTLFFAAQSGRRSYEVPKLQHGVFTYYLLEGLRGKASDEDDEITLQGLASYVSKRVQEDSPGLLREVGVTDIQKPNMMGNWQGALLLGRIDSDVQAQAGELREDNSLKLPFSFCPRKDGKGGFWIATTEITQEHFRAILGSEQPWEEHIDFSEFKEDSRCPVVYVTLDEAKHFCDVFTSIERKSGRLSENEVYRLLTSDEWLQAATYSPAFDELDITAWFESNCVAVNENFAHPVGLKRPNGLGLYDMQGNVWELCQDTFKDNPQIVCVCGGGWNSTKEQCEPQSKSPWQRDSRDATVGFRICKSKKRN